MLLREIIRWFINRWLQNIFAKIQNSFVIMEQFFTHFSTDICSTCYSTRRMENTKFKVFIKFSKSFEIYFGFFFALLFNELLQVLLTEWLLYCSNEYPLFIVFIKNRYFGCSFTSENKICNIHNIPNCNCQAFHN